MGLFGGDSKSNQTTKVDNEIANIAGGDVGESAIVGAGGAQITVNNTGGDTAFGFASAIADTAFGAISEVSAQTKDVERSAILGESSVIAGQASGERTKFYIVGGLVLLAAVLVSTRGK